MLNKRSWVVSVAMFIFGLAVVMFAPDCFTKTVNAAEQEVAVTEKSDIDKAVEVTTEDIWKAVYQQMIYETESTPEVVAMLALAEIKARDLELMNNATDHIVNYHGQRFAITDDEYQVLLKIVEAEAPDEDIEGKMLVANVVLNRLEEGFGDSISDVVFAKDQFEPVTNGRIFRVEPSEDTIEAVKRVLNGEDESQGALYFMARARASKKGIKWFDTKLKFLFKHGRHEFYTEK